MSVHVQLNPSPHNIFTNLDTISGTVVLILVNDANIQCIQVKLEGESTTRLAGPRNGFNERPDRKKTEFETHKLLYKVENVFPTPEIKKQASSNASFTLPPGRYEYPFRFKQIPFNNDCHAANLLGSKLTFAGVLETGREGNRHVKKTLPPSLSGFPGEALIRYYVKVTVVRPQFYKENYRDIVPFKFFPIEPPRPAPSKEETYARRQHQFTSALPANSKKKGLFDALKGKPPPTVVSTSEPPRFSADARLPHPSIITCNEPLPLRILVHKLSASPDSLYLRTLQIELIHHTTIRAHDLMRTESASWVICSLSNLMIPVGKPDDAVGSETLIDDNLWNKTPLPNTVAPTFDTCNISRSYELEVRAGFVFSSGGTTNPQLAVIPLRLPVQVFSGIAPNKALLSAISASPAVSSPTGLTPKPPPFSSNAMPPYSANGQQASAPFEDAPPSYEDAMADDIGPLDGPRRDYNPPVDPAGANGEKVPLSP
ncbi:MAG: hypothetical protein M1819_002340 [Sarea resinae]|nr:MAG: hypothetical protein M1819_002340 [Sarea resinae]